MLFRASSLSSLKSAALLIIFACFVLILSVAQASASENEALGGGQPAVINEIMYDPSAVLDSNGEWFEIYNPNSFTLDLDGFVMKDDDFDSHNISDSNGNTVIPANGYIVFCEDPDAMANGGVTCDYDFPSSFSLGNSGDELVLTYGDGTEFDRVEWGPGFADPTGATLSLCNPGLDNNDGANWKEAEAVFGDGDLGTPGAENGVCPVVFDDIVFPLDEFGPTTTLPFGAGGIITLDMRMVNTGPDDIEVDFWSVVEHESGKSKEIWNSTSTVVSGLDVTGSKDLEVSSNAKPGAYTYSFFIGDYPSTIEATFVYEIDIIEKVLEPVSEADLESAFSVVNTTGFFSESTPTAVSLQSINSESTSMAPVVLVLVLLATTTIFISRRRNNSFSG